MRECVGLSVGATNLVAARADGRAIVRKAAVSWRGTVLSGFVERFGDPVPIVAADGSAHAADRLVVEALADLTRAQGGAERTSVAVPAHWQPHLVDRMRALLPDATVTSDAVAALTALRAIPGLPARGIVALFDFGATGTTITLADAAADFRTVGEAVRNDDFSGDMIDRTLLTHLLAGVDVDPSGTSAVASLTAFREQVRIAKEQLSFQSATGLRGPQPGTTIRLTRAELESMVREPLDGVLAAFDDTLRRNGIWPSEIAAVATVGGGARIPLVTQRLSEALRMPVATTADAQSAAAIGAALIGGRDPETATRIAMASQTGTLLAPAAAPPPPVPVPAHVPPSPAVAAQAWSEADAVDDPAWARPEVVFDHSAVGEALPPLAWYQRPALLFAAAACAAVFAAVGLVVTTDTDAANASSPLPSASATPSMSDAGVPATANAAAPPVVTQTLVAAGRPNVRYTQAPQAQRAPVPQEPAPAPAPQNPPPAPVTTTPPTSTTTPTTTNTAPTTTTTSTTTSTSAPPPPPPSSSSSEPPPPPPSSSEPPPPSSSAEPPPPSSPPSSSTATAAPEANPPAGS